MGLCAMLWPPTGDLYRHNMTYFDFHEMSVDQFLDFMELRFDFVLYVVSFSFAQISIPFEFIKFLFVFIAYKLTFCVFEDCLCRNPHIGRLNAVGCFIVFFSVQFFTIVQGLRFGFAASLLAFGSYQYLVRRKRLGMLYIAVSCITHFSVIPVVLVLFIARLGIKIKSLWIVVLSVVCLLCLNPRVLQSIIDILPINAVAYAALSGYVTGYWGGEFLEDHSVQYQIAKYLGHLMMYPLLYFTIRNGSGQPFSQFAKLLIVIVCACFAISDTLYFRIAILFIPVGVFLFFIGSRGYLSLKVYLLLLCGCLSFVSQIYAFRREAAISREYMLFYPVPFGFSTTFSEQWIDQHVYDNGEGK